MEHNDRRGETKEIIRDYRRDFKNRESGSSSENTGAYSRKTHSRKTTYDLLGWRGSQTSFTGENDRSFIERISKLELFEENVQPKRERVFTHNQTDRQHEDCLVGICVHETEKRSGETGSHLKPRDQRVRFNPKLEFFEVPNEDRTSEWMTAAVDRSRFERRIQETGCLIEPILKRRLKLYNYLS